MVVSPASTPFTTLIPDWQWQIWQDLPYLTCRLLEPWRHGFFTQQFSPRVPEEIAAVFEQETSVYRVKQVHGNRILTPQAIELEIKPEIEPEIDQETGKDRPPADGIVTDGQRQAIWVASADCTRVLIGDS